MDEQLEIYYEDLEKNLNDKLDSLFGVDNLVIEVNPGKFLIPPKYREIAERILKLNVKQDDVWLLSFPRTGSTVTQELVWCVGSDLDFEGAKRHIHQRAPILELDAFFGSMNYTESFVKQFSNSVTQVENLLSPRFIYTHLRWNLLPKKIQTTKPKLIYFMFTVIPLIGRGRYNPLLKSKFKSSRYNLYLFRKKSFGNYRTIIKRNFMPPLRKWTELCLGFTGYLIGIRYSARSVVPPDARIIFETDFNSWINKNKIIYISRNSKDVCVSLYHMCILWWGFRGTFDDFCELFLQGTIPWGNYWEHVAEIWKKKNESNILFLKYEDVRNDLKGTIKRLSQHLNKHFTDDQVESLMEHVSFSKMRQNQAVNRHDDLRALSEDPAEEKNSKRDFFMRKAQIGGWRNFMSAEVAKKFDEMNSKYWWSIGLQFED